MKANTVEDVLANVDDSAGPDECWPWTLSRSPRGYGKVKLQGRDWRVHRLVAAHFIGPVDGTVVRHTCDNPPCCNPDHLRIGTQADNIDDKMAKGRWRGNLSRGEDRPRAKLTEADVRAIRQLVGSASNSEIGRRFGIGSNAVQSISTGETWGWLPNEDGSEWVSVRSSVRYTKLMEGDVREVKAALAEGETRASLARRFGVTWGCIDGVASGKTWGWVK